MCMYVKEDVKLDFVDGVAKCYKVVMVHHPENFTDKRWYSPFYPSVPWVLGNTYDSHIGKNVATEQADSYTGCKTKFSFGIHLFVNLQDALNFVNKGSSTNFFLPRGRCVLTILECECRETDLFGVGVWGDDMETPQAVFGKVLPVKEIRLTYNAQIQV